MCGIFGYCLNTRVMPDSMSYAIAVLAMAMHDRGSDSWGIMYPDRAARGLGSILRSNSVRTLNDVPMFSAHTRFATHGGKTLGNAHPFDAGAITGMHNGVLSNHDALNRQYHRNFSVDSQHIFAHIAEGLDLAELQGYGTIVYQSRDEPGAFNIGTFNGGELAIAEISYGKTKVGVMWASTFMALSDACDIADFDYDLFKTEDGKVYRVEDGNLFYTDVKLPMGGGRPVYAYGEDYGDYQWSGTRSYQTGRWGTPSKSGSNTWYKDKNGIWQRIGTPDPKAAAAEAKTVLSGGGIDSDSQADLLEVIAAGGADDDTEQRYNDDDRLMAEQPCDGCGMKLACDCADCYCAPCMARDALAAAVEDTGDDDVALARLLDQFGRATDAGPGAGQPALPEPGYLDPEPPVPAYEMPPSSLADLIGDLKGDTTTPDSSPVQMVKNLTRNWRARTAKTRAAQREPK